MVLVDVNSVEAELEHAQDPFPQDVEFMISALEAGPRPICDRHKLKRTPYRVRAALRLFSDGPGMPPWLLYTRNVTSRALGFLTPQCLPLSHGGVLSIVSPKGGKVMQISCTILRCREAVLGWYEGAVYFNRPQMCFDAEYMS
ncbi:MAG TPA: hypothetical protein VHP11_02875 [Tepidisphaeraceae bacterium]|nr:hypothetical protein [Tepidisphaeraceae bacterium]